MKSSRFNEGDKVRVSGGPYYLTRCGKKIKLGESGLGVFKGLHPDGKGALIVFDGERASSYVYIGPTEVSPITGTHLRPHKISKKRKKNQF